MGSSGVREMEEGGRAAVEGVAVEESIGVEERGRTGVDLGRSAVVGESLEATTTDDGRLVPLRSARG